MSHVPTVLDEEQRHAGPGLVGQLAEQRGVTRGTDGHGTGGGGQDEVDHEVDRGRRRVGPAEAPAGGQRPAASLRHEDHGGEPEVGGADQGGQGCAGSQQRQETERGLRRCTGTYQPAQGSERVVPSEQGGHGARRVVGAGCLGRAGDDEQCRGDEVDADQGHGAVLLSSARAGRRARWRWCRP